MASRAGRAVGFVFKHLLRWLWVATMVLTPLFGFWLASSLAAYKNATQWLALLVGLLLFPILPVGWDMFAVWRKQRRADPKKPPEKAFLTRLDRLVLRTLLIDGAFLFITLYAAKATAFRALAVRGDWMLDGHYGPIASTIRSGLLGIADRLDKRRVKDDHRYGDSDDAPDDPWKGTEPPKPTATKDPTAWPMAVEVDPLVRDMPDSVQESIDSVGKYLASRFSDKKLLVKAIHDYVVMRMEYDDDALAKIEAKDYANTPSQEAEAVFVRRKAVCAGYARLMVAIGKAAGVELAYVTGFGRNSRWRPSKDPTKQENLEGESHAWNAVKIDESWYLVDATWDDPTGGTPRTTYLMTPPKLMSMNHLPKTEAWQLRADPISLGDFVRQPLMSPAIAELGLSLAEPTRSQITVDGEAEILLDNPQGAKMIAVAVRDGQRGGKETHCKVAPKETQLRITCELPAGEWEVQMFAGNAASHDLDYVGTILVNSH